LCAAGNASIKVTAKRQELVVFVGLPASGKSTFAERYFVPEGYVRINQVHRLCACLGAQGLQQL
jgi:predicted kinase